ncbi:shufflon system plasmid conjugative transfer pilus tip adhesin PilV [Escherichia coli]|uniref:shufflon system plasmid conjugative transfer pilus tip adhesin PilV n=2 Tax=Escherichia coli TaxID=562 RepID=UPI001BCEFAE6|nr:shufflon system plasmid conjugative transfer pilus tip adhesin PilV [Escherichia coli]MBS4360309.1 shufflon system plasmid conjugative transfer pilus tip adhesin PilV [Escherichia coli]MBS4453884.1 shufflon system plasmid conjugative transfer pilus tip adhesin PilV [Escherichia coli]HCP9562051.1 shufflon system plasmid conjugative transfer pilus tip adhesin PilV [Escherichia coli]
MQKDDDKGFVLFEILAGLIVIGIATPMIYSEIENWLNEQLYQSAAYHADAYNTAARNYIADNNARLHSGSLPANFTADDLIRQGYLKQGFNHSPFGQSYITGIRRNQTTGRLEALTCSTGGQTIKEEGLRSVAGQLPGLGGFISKNGTATGAFGAWTDKPGDYGLTCSAGHIAVVMSGDDLQESDRLYRFQVAGRPELNQMHTAINMGGNNINNTGNINGQSATLKGDITSEDGWLITRNNKGWMNITHGGGFTMTDSQWIRAVNGKGITTTGEIKGGKVSGGTVRSDGRLSTGEYLQLDKTATAGTKCAPDGLVGRTSTGAILSCQSGSWTSSQKKERFTVYGISGCGHTPSYAVCPDGSDLVSGGYQLTAWSQDNRNPFNSPDSSYPDWNNKRWVVGGTGTITSCFRSVAVCAR